MDKQYTFKTVKERPDLVDEINILHNIGWINYMREDSMAVVNLNIW